MAAFVKGAHYRIDGSLVRRVRLSGAGGDVPAGRG